MTDVSLAAFLWSYKDKVQLAAYVCVFLYCQRRGAAAPERLLSALLLAFPVTDAAYHHAAGGSIMWAGVDVGHMAIDMLALNGMCAIALLANRVYPLWIAAAQIIAVSGHFYRMLLTQIDTFAYDVMTVVPCCVQLVPMALGMAFHMSRYRRLGPYPSWRRTSSTPVADRRVA